MTDVKSTNSQKVLDIILDRRRQEIDPNSSPQHFFEFFTAEQILKNHDLSYDELESGLAGGSGDGGIDGMYLFINGDLIREDTNYSIYKKNIVIDLIIFQSKTHAGFQESPVERFITISTDIFDLSEESLVAGDYNKHVVEAIQRFRKCSRELTIKFPKYNVSFFYASRGTTNIPRGIARKVSKLKKKVKLFTRNLDVDFEFLGADELYDRACKQPMKTHELQIAEAPISPDGKGFVCLVNLADFFKFIINEKNELHKQLFEANVRDYQGNVTVNRAIRQSLGNAEEDFWWLNNGVSILSTAASQIGKTLLIQDPQIVNGLQTSKEIYNYCKVESPDESRKILVRVMVTDKDESRDHIIRATNSQTSVPSAYLKSTDPIHGHIEEYLKTKGLFYDRRKNYYKNEGKPRNKIIGIPRLAQAVMAIALRQPDQARARPSTLINDDTNYSKIFNRNYPLELYYVCIEGMRKIESCLKSPSLGVESKYINDLRFYVAMYAIAGTGSQLPEIDEIVKFDLSCIDEAKVKLSLDVVMPKYSKLGGDARASRSSELLKSVLND